MDEFQIYSGNYIRMLFSTLGARFCMAHTMRLIRCWDKRSSVGRKRKRASVGRVCAVPVPAPGILFFECTILHYCYKT